MKDFTETVIDSQEIYEGSIFTIEKQKVLLPNQKIAGRDIVRHRGAVCILACVEDQLLLVRQYRCPIKTHLLEIPAGKLDGAEENPLDAAKRELEEETQFAAAKWTKLGTFYSSPGFCDESLTLFLAENLSPVACPKPMDEDEFLEIVYISQEEARELLSSGKELDLKTVVAIQHWLYQVKER